MAARQRQLEADTLEIKQLYDTQLNHQIGESKIAKVMEYYKTPEDYTKAMEKTFSKNTLIDDYLRQLDSIPEGEAYEETVKALQSNYKKLADDKGVVLN